MKVEFFEESNGKKLLEVWTESVSQIPEVNDTVILPVVGASSDTELTKKRFKVKTREFYIAAARFDKVQLGVVVE